MKFLLLIFFCFLAIHGEGQSQKPEKLIRHPLCQARQKTHLKAESEAKRINEIPRRTHRLEVSLPVPGVQSILHLPDSMYKYKWDTTSNAWEKNYRERDYVRDAEGWDLSFLRDKWTGSEWINFIRTTYTYDQHHNATSAIGEVWENNAWKNSFRSLWLFDASDNMLSQKTYDWDGSGWVITSQDSMEYDAQNNMTSETWSQENGGVMENNFRNLYTFNTNGDNISERYQPWENGAWQNYSVDSMFYDGSFNNVLRKGYYWENGTWILSYETTYSYNGNLKTQGLVQVWSVDHWDPYSRFTYSYDAFDHLVSSLTEDYQNGTWEYSARDTVTYDANQLFTSWIYQGWDGSAWYPYYIQRVEYVFDSVLVDYSNFNFLENGTVVSQGDSMHYYFDGVTGAKPAVVLQKEALLVYPNPVRDLLSVRVDALSEQPYLLFNQMGKVMMKGVVLPGQNQLDVTQLPHGLYYLRTAEWDVPVKVIKE